MPQSTNNRSTRENVLGVCFCVGFGLFFFGLIFVLTVTT